MLAIVAAVAKNNVIGIKNRLPWNLPEDLKRFKELTAGKTVMMGSKTFESIVSMLGKPLPNRTNVVLAREANYKVPAFAKATAGEAESVVIQTSIPDALRNYGSSDIFVIGGGEIYRQTIDLADTLYITHIDKEVEGDTHFPEIDPKKWHKISEDPHEGYSFAVYKKIK